MDGEPFMCFQRAISRVYWSNQYSSSISSIWNGHFFKLTSCLFPRLSKQAWWICNTFFLEPKPTWLSKLKTTPLGWWYWSFSKAKKLESLLKTQVTIPQVTLEVRESHSPPQTSAVHPCLLKATFQDYCSFTSEIIDQPSEAPSSVPGAAGHWPSFE